MTDAAAAALRYLDRKGAMARRHSGRNLYDHLVGTSQILRRWQADDAVCLAGLCHSVYDTHTYRADLDIERQELCEIIGLRAEALAWRFRNIHLFERAAVVRRPALIHRLSAPLQALFLIGAANLVEQSAYLSIRKLGSAPRRYRAILTAFGPALPQPAALGMAEELPCP